MIGPFVPDSQWPSIPDSNWPSISDSNNGNLWVSGHELVEGDDASDRIMPGSGSHTKVNREVHGNIGIVNAEHV